MTSIDACGLSNSALQNIRETLKLSLDRMKQLEYQVKVIPDLQDEVTHLRLENQRLHDELELEKTQQLNRINGSYNQIEQDRKRSLSFTYIDNFDDQEKKVEPLTPRKDCGVMCGVLTRTVGVGHQYPHTKHAWTLTTEFADKWLPDKVEFLNSQSNVVTITKGTQTFQGKEKRDMGIQASILEPKKVTLHHSVQTDVILKPLLCHVGSLAKTPCSDIGVQKTINYQSIGCSDDKIDSMICDRCSALRSDSDGVNNSTPVSLAALSNRSKSFNLGDERLDFKKKSRCIAIQCDSHVFSSSKSSQVTVVTKSKATQHEIKYMEKQVQYENNGISRSTDTQDLEEKLKLIDRASSPIVKEEKEMEESKEFKKDTVAGPSPSRIPVPTTPIETRKFRRQDTYTKVYSTSPPEKSPGAQSTKLSGLDLSPKVILNDTFENVKQSLRLESSSGADSSSKSPFQKVQTSQSTLPFSESTLLHPTSQNRKKAIPSKEMQGALKVLNDSLQKNPSKPIINQNAINIVQQEWFKISSLITAKPLDVEDYLDAFEDMSSMLLQYVVNMTDISGNTAMHYAVSHGNFDVVSILLDSKVCDINKPNKAGYTSVMLVSLAEVRSQTHANVVKKLFQLADVNIRATQHGQTALMLAVSHGHLDMVKMLLEAGADINIQDEDGSTALMCAAEHGHIEIVKHFLSQPDCDSSITDVDGSTALKIAMEAGHRHIGVLLYAHERNSQKSQSLKLKKTNSNSPKTPSSPLPIRSSRRALTDTKQ
ncbi:hypothetical protein ABEB36_010840 [Hypothenemus hampei]